MMKAVDALLIVAVCVSGMVARAEDVDFNRDVRPILSAKCFACHGFDQKSRQADLRLDLATEALATRDGVTPFKPGDLAGSAVWQRISSNDPEQIMPPVDSNLKLTDQEKTQIKNWILQGAKYAKHWSFIPPEKSRLPKIPAAYQNVTPIDHFVLAKLKDAGLKPAKIADKYTLIRRLSFDLTGLPPSAADVEKFVNDNNPDAYEQLVDRLLQSPHFGERMALDWLDAARYADTNGFSIDGGRHIWLWRDWVIHAFNTNKRYNTFLLEQLAGDLLPNATPAQLIATGFQRNNMVTHEGGTIPAENLTNYNADRVKTLGEAVLGLTLGCAQCHDHKYDPVTQKDYYSLFAYFNSISDFGLDGNRGINPRPYIKARTVLQTGEQEQLKTRITKLQQQLANPPEQAFQSWQKRQRKALALRGRNMQLLPLTIRKVSTPNRGAGFEVQQEQYVRITQTSSLAAYDVLAKLPKTTKPITGLRVIFHPDEKTPGGGWGYGPRSQLTSKTENKTSAKGTFRLTALSVSVGSVPADQVDLYRMLTARRVTANSWQPEHRPELCLDMRNQNGFSPQASHEGRVQLTMTFQQPIDATQTPYMTTQLNFGFGDSLIASKMELFALTGHDDDSTLPPEIIVIIETEPNQRSEQQVAKLNSYFSEHSREMAPVRVDLANARERLSVLTESFSTMVMNIADKPRKTYILNRGDYSQPIIEVGMSTPAALPKLSGEQQDRLALARWLTMRENPLTARVYVNRIWQILFGAGIVRTPADFGSQGEWPTHPELLDWLAVDFMEQGWDVKALIKQITLSRTYRQSSRTSAIWLERDPQNRLLARGPRYRLPAEFIRDAALKTSGLLTAYLGGPSVNPYTPGDIWREISHYGSTPATAQTFVQDHGEKLYRRSLYTFWKRTAPPPNMAAFDAPNRETCVVARPSTNTPLQALVLLNDVQFVEAARKFAERIMQQKQQDQARLEWAMRAALSRPISKNERDVLLGMLSRERNRYQQDQSAARALHAVGESPRDETIPAAELAAWTQIASTLFNLSEFVTRN